MNTFDGLSVKIAYCSLAELESIALYMTRCLEPLPITSLLDERPIFLSRADGILLASLTYDERARALSVLWEKLANYTHS